MATERMTTRVREGFDPTNQAHVDKLLENLQKKMPEKGTGWELQSYDPSTQEVTWTRQSAITQVTKSAGRKDSYDVALPAGTKPVDGDKVAAKLESDPRHLGYTMTAFEPYLGQATLSRMTPEALRCRGAISTALGCKPWDIPVAPRPDGGFSVGLPRTYVPSRHDSKILEVAESVVGTPGWFIQVDTRNLKCEIIPADPPTFPAAIPYPFDKQFGDTNDFNWSLNIPIGVKLGAGGVDGEELMMDLDATPGGLISGTAGSGKSVTINAFLFGVLARGHQLVVGDIFHKSVDFTWVRPFVRDYGFGCANKASTYSSLAMLFEEGERRAGLLRDHGVQKWQDLPDAIRPPLIVAVVDEITALFAAEEIPKGLPKDHELVLAAQQDVLETSLLKRVMSRLPAEMRFTGIRLVLATQQAQANTGVSVPLKTNLANRMLLGANPNEAARGHALLDARSAPVVPDHLKADKKASRGVGVAEFEGQEPCIFKTYYASTDDYAAALIRMGVPQTMTPEPNASHIAKYVPNMDDGFGGGSNPNEGYGKKPRKLESWEIDPETGQAWKDPRQRANAAKHQLSV